MDNDSIHRVLPVAKKVLKDEAGALLSLSEQLGKEFLAIFEAILSCRGKVVLVGMGKSGHVARKVAATMSSLGTCAISVHPAECTHGDLGMIQRNDLVLLMSKSGESEEILQIIPSLRMIGVKLIGITCNRDSTLARSCSIVQVLDGVTEACHLDLAPTTSTTLMTAYGDALAVALSQAKGFKKEDFGIFHPAGSLGKRLTVRVVDLLKPLKEETLIRENATLAEAVIAISESGADILMVTNDKGLLIGILTNGDLKRAIACDSDIRKETIRDMINRYPYYVDADSMAIEALRIAIEKEVNSLAVVRNDIPVGVLSKDTILDVGIHL